MTPQILGVKILEFFFFWLLVNSVATENSLSQQGPLVVVSKLVVRTAVHAVLLSRALGADRERDQARLHALSRQRDLYRNKIHVAPVIHVVTRVVRWP